MQNEPTTTATAPLDKQHLPLQQPPQLGRHLQSTISQRGGALYPSEDVHHQFKPTETTSTGTSGGGVLPQQQQPPHLMNQQKQGLAPEELPYLQGGVLHQTPPKPAQPVAPAVTTSPFPLSSSTDYKTATREEEDVVIRQKMMTLPTRALMPAVALSTWKPVKDIGPVVENALRAGYRHFDCAWIYGNQVQVGDSLQKWIKAGAPPPPAAASSIDQNVSQSSTHNRRDELFISSKVWNIFHTDVRKHCLDTLHQLSLTRLDLLLLQWPTAFLPSRSSQELNVFPSVNGLAMGDESAWLLDTWFQMEELVKEGLVSAIGVCNFNVRQIERIVESCSIPPSVIQVELHPLLPQFAIRELCARYGICLVACPPLGAISDPSSSSSFVSKSTATLEQDATIVAMARELNIEPEELIYRYALEIGCGVVQKASQRLETMRKKIMVASISPSVSGGSIDERREEPIRHDSRAMHSSQDVQRGGERRLLSPKMIRRLEQIGDESPHRFVWFAGARNLREYPF